MANKIPQDQDFMQDYGPWQDEEIQNQDFKMHVNVSVKKERYPLKKKAKLNIGTLIFGRLQSIDVKKLERVKKRETHHYSLQHRKIEPVSWLPEMINFSRI